MPDWDGLIGALMDAFRTPIQESEPEAKPELEPEPRKVIFDVNADSVIEWINATFCERGTAMIVMHDGEAHMFFRACSCGFKTTDNQYMRWQPDTTFIFTNTVTNVRTSIVFKNVIKSAIQLKSEIEETWKKLSALMTCATEGSFHTAKSQERFPVFIRTTAKLLAVPSTKPLCGHCSKECIAKTLH